MAWVSPPRKHIALAEKLVSRAAERRFDRVILDKKIDSRDDHLQALGKLLKQCVTWTGVDEKYSAWQDGALHPNATNRYSTFKLWTANFKRRSTSSLQAEGHRRNGSRGREHPR